MPSKAYQIQIDGSPLPQTCYRDLVSLVVDEPTGSPGRFELRMTDGPIEGTRIMNHLLFELFRRVSIRIGFSGAGQLQHVFEGFITHVGMEMTSEPGHCEVVAKGLDTCVLLSLEEKVVSWPDATDSAIVSQIISNYGFTADVRPTAAVHQQVVQRGTDLEFVRNLASRNGMEFYFEADAESGEVIAVMGPPDLFPSVQKDLAIGFGEESNLLRVDLEQNGLRPLAVKTAQLDILTNAVQTGQSRSSTLISLGAVDSTQAVGSALRHLVRPKDTQSQMLVLGPPTSDAAELNAQAQSVRDEADWYLMARGEINSDAYQSVLRPHKLVQIKGVNPDYDGPYHVTRVIHELAGDGRYTQRFEARRNARALRGDELLAENAVVVASRGL